MQEEYNKQFPPMWARKDRVNAAWYRMVYQLKESTGRVVPTWTRPGRAQLAWKRMWWKLIYADEMDDFQFIDADEPTVDLRSLPTVRLTAAPDSPLNQVAVLRLRSS